MKKYLLLAFMIIQQSFANQGPYFAPRFHDHDLEDALAFYMDTIVNEGRIKVYALKAGDSLDQLPAYIRENLRSLDINVLGDNRVYPDPLLIGDENPAIRKLVNQITEESYRETVSTIVNFGSRATVPAAFVPWAMEKFHSYGLAPVFDYNILAFKEGTLYPDEHVVIIGHMDTVSSTVGADDNASGAAGVLEIARVFQNVRTDRSIWFILAEDEEQGLLGARYFVNRMRESQNLQKIKHVINMDMIAYNTNGVVDLETSKDFESFADLMAGYAHRYTNLVPNKVLNPWGSDHVPFIDAGIPALLTIEHWSTHTPCWHRSCDTLGTLNFAYGKEVVRLNVAALAELAGVGIFGPLSVADKIRN